MASDFAGKQRMDRDMHHPSASAIDSEPRSDPEMAIVVISVGAPTEIAGAVQSIINLKRSCEVIVVNSGGGDVRQRLGPLCNHVKIVEHDAVLWVGDARNLGIMASSAPYIAFLAADCRICDGWIDKRMALHRQGHMAVASAVVAAQGWNPFAWASHFLLFGNRLPDVPAKNAAPFGASYDRQLFTTYGLFRGDLRIGEDTEFHQRLPRNERPVWAPEVLTIHRAPNNPISMLSDQYRRGERFGRYWPNHRNVRLKQRLYNRFLALGKIIRRRNYNLGTRLKIIGCMPLIAVNIGVYELGHSNGRKARIPLATHEAAAQNAERAKKWVKASANWRAAADLSPNSPTLKLNQIRCLRMAGRVDEAMAICCEVGRDYPHLAAPIEERARIHEQSGAWDEAIACWAQLADLHPRPGRARLNQAHALSIINDWEGARSVYEGARMLMPGSRSPLRGLAMVASAQGDHDVALTLYQALWDRFSDEAALVNWIDLLLRLGRRDEALSLISRVEASAVSIIKKLAARTIFLHWHHDWNGIVDLLEAHPMAIIRSQRLLSLHIDSLCFLNRQSDAQAAIAWKGIPRTAARRHALDILLRFGDYDAALPRLEEKFEKGNIDEIAAHYATPLIIGGYDNSGLEHSRKIVTSLAEGAYTTPRGEILHLSLPYHKVRVESLARLEGREQSQIRYPEEEVIDLLSKARIRTFAPDAYDNLKTISLMLSEMRRTVPDFFPDPIYNFLDTLAVARRILSAIDKSQPLSLIRLGDGEGRFFQYPSHLENYLESDRIASAQVWWNMGGGEATSLHRLSALVSTAVDTADILGIPDLPRVIRGSSAGVGRPRHGMARNARGLLAALGYASAIIQRSAGQATSPPMITSCHIHEALAFWNLWPSLLRHMREVSLITCHQNLPDALRRQFGVETRTLHLIPAESKYAPLFRHDSPDEPHFPDVFHRIEQNLASTAPGHVVLVAAGVLGKIYCQRVREAGGIAIDIGSVADYWNGYITRGYDETLTYRSPTSLPALYDALANRDPDFSHLWQVSGGSHLEPRA